jgi:hypothetical protein
MIPDSQYYRDYYLKKLESNGNSALLAEYQPNGTLP